MNKMPVMLLVCGAVVIGGCKTPPVPWPPAPDPIVTNVPPIPPPVPVTNTPPVPPTDGWTMQREPRPGDKGKADAEFTPAGCPFPLRCWLGPKGTPDASMSDFLQRNGLVSYSAGVLSVKPWTSADGAWQYRGDTCSPHTDMREPIPMPWNAAAGAWQSPTLSGEDLIGTCRLRVTAWRRNGTVEPPTPPPSSDCDNAPPQCSFPFPASWYAGDELTHSGRLANRGEFHGYIACASNDEATNARYKLRGHFDQDLHIACGYTNPGEVWIQVQNEIVDDPDGSSWHGIRWGVMPDTTGMQMVWDGLQWKGVKL